MDPYCKVEFEGKHHKTETKSDGGKHPKWHHKFELKVNDIRDKIEFRVFDSNTFSDDQIAHTMDLTIFNIVGPSNGMTEDHHLFWEKKDRGTIKIRTAYVPHDNGDQQDNSAQEAMK